MALKVTPAHDSAPPPSVSWQTTGEPGIEFDDRHLPDELDHALNVSDRLYPVRGPTTSRTLASLPANRMSVP